MRYNVKVMGVALVILLAVVAVAVAMMMLYDIYYYVLRGLLARTTTVPATVIRKQQCDNNVGGLDSGSYDTPSSEVNDAACSYNFYVLFAAQGKEIEFPVSERVYADASEGDTGLLTHKGTLFRRFLKDADLPTQTGRVQIRKV